MNRRTRQALQSAAKVQGTRILTPLSVTLLSIAMYSVAFVSTANANELDAGISAAGIIDKPVLSATALSVEDTKKLVDTEQTNLAKKERPELVELATKGERLAQVALGTDFANEAQQILFAPDAANAALSDALAWYSLAAQRGYPGTRSLNSSGVKFHAVRVVRNR